MSYQNLRWAPLVLALGLTLAGCGDLSTNGDASTPSNADSSVQPSAQWPAMTMDFHLAKTIEAGDLEPGQRIRFEFTTDDGGTVTKIGPAP